MRQQELSILYGKERASFHVPSDTLLYSIAPAEVPACANAAETIKSALRGPIGTASLTEEVEKGMRVVIIGDDATRPTPNEALFPVLLDELNGAGIADDDISVLIALGTHRYMSTGEILAHYGREVHGRVKIVNHEWKDESQLMSIGSTASGIPVHLNKMAHQADYLIATGSIVPHSLAGWGGGGKAVQPGVCGWETTGRTHVLPLANNRFLTLSGEEDGFVRQEMEEVAALAGLRFILNVVLNKERDIVDAVAGDQVAAHRAGVRLARNVYERSIPAPADIVIVSAAPADLDYWQGTKPLSYAQSGLKEGGTVILVGSFPEGISPVHTELATYGRKSYAELSQLYAQGAFEDLVCAGILFQHARCRDRSQILCVSDGLSQEDKEALGFAHAASIAEALAQALRRHGDRAQIGVIDYGGDVLPRVDSG